MSAKLEWGKQHATPGWAKSTGPSAEGEFVKNLHRAAREAARTWLRSDGTECGFASDAYLARRVAQRLGHKHPVGTPIEYLSRCHKAGLLRNNREVSGRKTQGHAS